MTQRRYLISGRVQGVNFRSATRQRARELGVQGYARNLPDGRVEVLAGGEPAAMEQLENFLWQGPSFARVTSVESEETDALVPLGFTIG